MSHECTLFAYVMLARVRFVYGYTKTSHGKGLWVVGLVLFLDGRWTVSDVHFSVDSDSAPGKTN